MATNEPRTKRDGFLGALGGMDSGRHPSLLDANVLAFGINVTLRGGFPATRPRLEIKSLTFPTTETQEWFEDHPLQGYTRTGYRTLQGKTLIVVSIGGRIFTISPQEDFIVAEITPTRSTTTSANFNAPAVDANVAITVTSSQGIYAGYPIYVNGKLYVVVSVSGLIVTATNKTDTPAALISSGALVSFLNVNIPDLPLTWMEQAEQYLIIQNNRDGAIIYDGTNSRRSDLASNEVPTGSAMCYNEEIGRLCVAVNGNEIAIGDIVGGPTGLLKFTETENLSTGGRFRVPLKYGQIKAMSMIANLDRSNGQGPMIVFAEEGFSTFNLPPNRETWKTLTYPPQINMPIRYSAMSQNSVVLVNGDLYYQAKDGLRSFLYAIRDFQQPGNVPISSEMDRIISHNTQHLLKFSAGILFDNRIIFTVSPAPSPNGTYHRGMGVLDLNLISRLGQKAPPVYDGIWTGIRPTGMMTGSFDEEERAFIFVLNSGDANELWELHKVSGYDNTESRISCAIETRAMNFGSPFTMDKLQGLEVWVDKVAGALTIGAQYRPDSAPCWFNFCATKELCAKDMECSDDLSCVALETFNPGYRTRQNFGQPNDECEGLDNKPSRVGYEFQFRLYWTGQCRIRRILARVQEIPEETYPAV